MTKSAGGYPSHPWFAQRLVEKVWDSRRFSLKYYSPDGRSLWLKIR
ncbi:hypothetical protein [Nostoc sp. KVJ20]|nr:hypothetical protein [Nostoc sp. KVJ20]